MCAYRKKGTPPSYDVRLASDDAATIGQEVNETTSLGSNACGRAVHWNMAAKASPHAGKFQTTTHKTKTE
ncbi:hypothetical protein [Bacillus piscicola]|uniref:hypothetical protein n=1 Tax=Bacillus piscicola TaxID=1632684 RepID=UPI001F091DB0|nr:hypothetical protein [Bacillus piscicola]